MPSHCPACSTALTQRSAWLAVCGNCGLYLSNLSPGPGKAFEGLEHLRKSNFERVLDKIEALRPLRGAKLLEVGTAKGWFLDAARRRGALPVGIEPVAEDAAAARSLGFSVEEGLFPQSPADRGPYDIIAFNDVFEHLPDPAEAAKAVADLLTSGGLLVVNIPSSDGVLFKTATALNRMGVSGPFERLWQKGLPSPHMSYFSPANLKRLIERHTGMRLASQSALPSVERRGLQERLASHPMGIPAPVAFSLIWGMSYVLPVLPSDISLSIFRKG